MSQYLLHQNILFRLLKIWYHWLMMFMGAARLGSTFPLGTVVVLFCFILFCCFIFTVVTSVDERPIARTLLCFF